MSNNTPFTIVSFETFKTYKGTYRGIAWYITCEINDFCTTWKYHAGMRGDGQDDSFEDCQKRIEGIIDGSIEAENKGGI